MLCLLLCTSQTSSLPPTSYFPMATWIHGVMVVWVTTKAQANLMCYGYTTAHHNSHIDSTTMLSDTVCSVNNLYVRMGARRNRGGLHTMAMLTRHKMEKCTRHRARNGKQRPMDQRQQPPDLQPTWAMVIRSDCDSTANAVGWYSCGPLTATSLSLLVLYTYSDHV